MNYIQNVLFHYHKPGDEARLAAAKPDAMRAKVNTGRLKAQVFACE